MLPVRHVRDEEGGGEQLSTPLRGAELLNAPLLNKGCAFDARERDLLGLRGLLPTRVETLEDQVARELEHFEQFETLLEKNDYLGDLQDRNEVLYYRLVLEHLSEMLPILYTPEVGEAVQKYSHNLRRPRGLYVAYPEIDQIDQILANRRCHEVDVLCATDAGAILGIGDQGVGGMGIPVAKLALDSLCGAVPPARALPVMLDVGTDNDALRSDPLYMGWREPRVSGDDYDRFIEKFVDAIKRNFPGVFLHWEDFAGRNARYNLATYRDQICSFNDDIQGTAAVCVASLYAGVKASSGQLRDRRIVVFGAGAAGLGNAEEIVQAMRREGLERREALSRIYAVDRQGLVVEGMAENSEGQRVYARPTAEVADWERDASGRISLEETVRRSGATVAIGTSTQGGAFSEAIVREMASHEETPIVFPLSNPTEKAEAQPADLLRWTGGRALIATGSPFEAQRHEGREVQIGQANNAFIFPGVTLGAVAVGARRVSDDMLWAATQALSDLSPALSDPAEGLLPRVSELRRVCRAVGSAVASQAVTEGLADLEAGRSVEQAIERQIWEPRYLPVRPSS